jgi:UDP-N-acetylglucosamine 2-epimerase (non-hydrolysing)
MVKILFIYGTRPEAIKMIPLILELKNRPDKFIVEVCLTGQHRQMLDQTNSFFRIKGDYDLNLMRINQTLSDFSARCIEGLDIILESSNPDLVFVQGDTTSVLCGALVSYYRRIPVAHLEAGLRSGNKYSPFPEEMNRKIAGQISELHFAPTLGAVENLRAEGIIKNVFMVGNTVIDALYLSLKLIHERGDAEYAALFSAVNFSGKVILVTGHRRESFGLGFTSICEALREIAVSNPGIEIVYPVHLNPNVREPVNRMLGGVPNIHLLPPLDYPALIWLMEQCYMVITDSGGIQEEAPALGKPVLVIRDVTERMEGVEAGTARLVGTQKTAIVKNAEELLHNPIAYEKMAKAINPYGNGKTSEKIAEILENIFRQEGSNK